MATEKGISVNAAAAELLARPGVPQMAVELANPDHFPLPAAAVPSSGCAAYPAAGARGAAAAPASTSAAAGTGKFVRISDDSGVTVYESHAAAGVQRYGIGRYVVSLADGGTVNIDVPGQGGTLVSEQ